MNEDWHNIIRYRHQSSMAYWYPKLIKKFKYIMPRTSMINIPEDLKEDIYNDRVTPALETFSNKVNSVINRKHFKYPLFIRSGHASIKHNWHNTCFVSSREVLRLNIFQVLRYTDLYELPLDKLFVREYIKLKSYFKTKKDLPIAQEVRVFVQDGKALCTHFYWVKDAVEQAKPTNPNWKILYKKLLLIDDKQMYQIVKYASAIGKHLDGYWSLDFAIDERDRIWFIDAARGELSWHPECEVKRWG